MGVTFEIQPSFLHGRKQCGTTKKNKIKTGEEIIIPIHHIIVTGSAHEYSSPEEVARALRTAQRKVHRGEKSSPGKPGKPSCAAVIIDDEMTHHTAHIILATIAQKYRHLYLHNNSNQPECMVYNLLSYDKKAKKGMPGNRTYLEKEWIRTATDTEQAQSA